MDNKFCLSKKYISIFFVFLIVVFSIIILSNLNKKQTINSKASEVSPTSIIVTPSPQVVCKNYRDKSSCIATKGCNWCNDSYGHQYLSGKICNNQCVNREDTTTVLGIPDSVNIINEMLCRAQAGLITEVFIDNIPENIVRTNPFSFYDYSFCMTVRFCRTLKTYRGTSSQRAQMNSAYIVNSLCY